jgi:predicted membrane-bound dolichyl-phosphate-mannose-protein mannosyltransferase
VLAFGFRVTALSTYGLSEDELNKVHAIAQYRAGHFSANAEHPMLMKLAMWASVDVAQTWNRVAPPAQAMSLETALRLPNAIAGAATTLVLFGVADLLFGGAVAVAASLIWAFDVNAIAINRIGKEDTFLLLFFLLAVFCYERAKRLGGADPDLPASPRDEGSARAPSVARVCACCASLRSHGPVSGGLTVDAIR